MKIDDVTLKDVENGEVFYWEDDKNTKIAYETVVPPQLLKNSGYYLITGKIKIADGTIYPAILGVSTTDQGELFEAYFYVDGKWLHQDEELPKKLGKTKKEVLPYMYHLNVKVQGDLHTGHQF